METEHEARHEILVSICIANFNGEAIIRDCLDSIFAQETSLRYEVIVHDDASQDSSIALLEDYGEKIVLIKSGENVGFCISNNRMADIASGQYILFLNNDAKLFPDALTTLYQHMQANPKSGILSLPQFDMQTGALIDRGMTMDVFCNPQANLRQDLEGVVMVMGSCLWLRTALWQEIGGFPEWFETLAEDMYVCLYARLLGEKVQVLQRSGYYHWVGHSLNGGKVKENRLVTSYRRKTKSERNKTYVMCLMFPLPVLVPVLPVHLLLFTLEGLLLSLVKRDPQIFRRIYAAALIDLFRNRRRLLRERKRIQVRRRIDSVRFLESFSFVPYKLKMLLKHGLPEIH